MADQPVPPPPTAGAACNHARAVVLNKPDNGWVGDRPAQGSVASRARARKAAHAAGCCQKQGRHPRSPLPKPTLPLHRQVHTLLANAEAVRTHTGTWAMLTRPPLPARLVQLLFQVRNPAGRQRPAWQPAGQVCIPAMFTLAPASLDPASTDTSCTAGLPVRPAGRRLRRPAQRGARLRGECAASGGEALCPACKLGHLPAACSACQCWHPDCRPLVNHLPFFPRTQSTPPCRPSAPRSRCST